jgi:hypothetical protein
MTMQGDIPRMSLQLTVTCHPEEDDTFDEEAAIGAAVFRHNEASMASSASRKKRTHNSYDGLFATNTWRQQLTPICLERSIPWQTISNGGQNQQSGQTGQQSGQSGQQPSQGRIRIGTTPHRRFHLPAKRKDRRKIPRNKSTVDSAERRSD